MFKKMGPGVLVAAAFIGPGTVTACTLAGVSFGFALLWALLVSVIATIVLQEMSARLGIVTQLGLADVIKQELNIKWTRYLVLGIILVAIVVGNAAYEAGNIGGAVLGLEALFGDGYSFAYPWIIGICAFLLLYIGDYKLLERVLVSLVLVMSLSFLLTAFITKPDLMAILGGMFIPTTPEGSILTIVALVGTTVVPYNLFLHASLVSEKWKSSTGLAEARRDTIIAIALGGVVSMSIIIAASSISEGKVSNVMDLAKGLEPLYGDWAKYFMGIGLFAAGVTSAITAPLAAAYVANSCFGWKASLKSIKFKSVWMIILFLGVFFMSFNIKPIEVIKFAQIANGILLPIIAIFLFWVVNRTSVMGRFKNTLLQNILGLVILVLAVVLGIKGILTVFWNVIMDNKYIDINCDVGEGIGNELDLMPLISSCNIACGGHAGNESTMLKVANLARQFTVKVGAHPSYPDPENFGRVSINIQSSKLIESIQTQMATFKSILKREGIALNHIKAHGALYNDISRDSDLARTFLKSIDDYKDTAVLYVPYGSAIEEEAQKRGFSVKREAFIDRNYNLDLSLVSRQFPDALIGNSQKVLSHLLRMVKEGHVLTHDGTKVHIQADTYCIHGDSQLAPEILNYLSEELPKMNIYIKK